MTWQDQSKWPTFIDKYHINGHIRFDTRKLVKNDTSLETKTLKP